MTWPAQLIADLITCLQVRFINQWPERERDRVRPPDNLARMRPYHWDFRTQTGGGVRSFWMDFLTSKGSKRMSLQVPWVFSIGPNQKPPLPPVVGAMGRLCDCWGANRVSSRHPNEANLNEELEFPPFGWCIIWERTQPPTHSTHDSLENDDRDVPRGLAKLGFAVSHEMWMRVQLLSSSNDLKLPHSFGNTRSHNE